MTRPARVYANLALFFTLMTVWLVLAALWDWEYAVLNLAFFTALVGLFFAALHLRAQYVEDRQLMREHG